MTIPKARLRAFPSSELSLASYANFDLHADLAAALRATGFSQSQAEAWLEDWNVVAQYHHTLEPYSYYDPNSGTWQTSSATNGLSCSVFEERDGGRRVLSIRGTNDANDLATNAYSIFALGSPEKQGQYISLKSKVAEWIADGTLPAQFHVAGHSLGGFLAIALTLEFPDRVEQAHLFNTPGLNGVANNKVLDTVANVYHVTNATYDPARFFSYRARPGISPIAGLGTQPSPPIVIEGEDHGLIQNHSISRLADSLAIYDVYDRLLASPAHEEIGAVIRSARLHNNDKLEGALDALRATLSSSAVVATARDDREQLYQRYQELSSSAQFAAVAGRATIDAAHAISHGSLARDARTDLGSLLALKLLTPFRLRGVDAQLASIHTSLEAERAHDASLSVAERRSNAYFSDAWLDDRARLLVWKNHAYGKDSTRARVPTPGNLLARDLELGISVDVVGTFLGGDSAAPPAALTFGSSTSETLVGTALADRLYGMAGNDTVDGAFGDDYVEGGAGDDTLRGGAGKDELAGGRDNDQLFGGSEDDRLDGGAGVDSLKGEGGRDVLAGGLDGDTLDGGVGRDQLAGGAGFDDYVLVTGDGDDVIVDSDGGGKIAVNTSPLVGGTLVATSRWHRLGVTYDFMPNADGRGDLAIRWGAQTTIVRGFRPGDLGIVINPGAINAPSPPGLFAGSTGDDNNLDGDSTRSAVLGTPSAERLRGLAGRDQLIGQGGNDVLEGGAGNDFLAGDNGDDWLFGGDAVELAAYSLAQSTVAGTAIQGDWLDGGNGNDVLVGGENLDALFGGGGQDIVEGAGGADMILGDTEGGFASLNWTRVEQSGLWVLSPAGYAPAASGDADHLRGGGGDDAINGEWGDDTLHGNDGNDQLTGYHGRDVMFGGKGNDLIVGDASGWVGVAAAPGATDFLFGGEGDDDLRGDGGDDQLYGDSGNDQLDGGDGDDLIDGGTGNDTIRAGAGADTIVGGDGADAIDGGADDDDIDGGLGNDGIIGGAGNDSIAGGEGDDQVEAREGDDVVYGGSGNDAVDGGVGADSIHGGDGDDLLGGGVGVDSLDGGIGNDVLFGGDDDDILAGGDGDDGLHGDAGRDTLAGDAGNDRLDGDLGDDWLAGGSGHDHLHGGDGDDRLEETQGNNVLAGGAGHDTIVGGVDSDYVQGGDGNDDIAGGAGSDLIDPGAGNDTVRLAFDAPDFYIGLGAGDRLVLPDGVTAADVDFMRASDENGATSHLAVLVGGQPVAIALDVGDASRPAFQTFDGATIAATTVNAALAAHQGEFLPIRLPGFTGAGSGGADVVVSPGGSTNYAAGDGDDRLTGAAMADTFAGDAGNDQLSGAGSDDVLDGGAGDDSLDGGDDDDTLAGGDGTDSLVGGSGDDLLRGGAGLDALQGGAGADVLEGDDGDDALDGGDGPDTLRGGAGRDLLVGAAGNDALHGGDGDDTLDGGYGNDTLEGGAGNDTLDGGAGDDTYVVDGLGVDRIRDTAGVSTVRFAAGITLASLTLTRGAVGTADEHALIVDFGGGQRTVIEDGLRRGPTRYAFADGTSLSRAELLGTRYAAALSISGDANLPSIAGGAGADTLASGTASHAELRGGGGNDSLAGGAGADRLLGDTGADTLVSGAAADYLHGGDGNDSLDAGDGDDFLDGGAGDDMLQGGAGRDLVLGGAGQDTFGSDAGDDVLRGGDGDDVYRLAAGGGIDAVVDASGANRVRFGPGIAIADALFRTSGIHVIAALADGSRLVLHNALDPEDSSATRITGFDFDSGSLTLADAVARATGYIAGDSTPAATLAAGTDGDDALAGATRAYGGRGDDTIGDSGSYLFGHGDGHDRITVSNPWNKQSPSTLARWVEMLPGVVREDVAFGLDGRDLLVTLRPGGDSIRVVDHFERTGGYQGSYPRAIAGVRFADGSTLSFDAIAQALETGTDGDDALGVVDSQFRTVHAGDGDDVVQLRETVSDVMGGDGDDTIAADPYLPWDTSWLFGEGGNDTLVASRANNARTRLYGGEGDDRLVGAPGARLDGGPGDDRIVIPGGATGGPTEVVFGRFAGRDAVTGPGDDGSTGPSASFVLRVTQGSYRDLLVRRDGDDLVLAIRDRDDRIAIPDFFAPGANYAGFTGIDVIDAATELRLPGSPTAADLAARAEAVAAAPLALAGEDAADLLVGMGANDALAGNGGDDELDGMSGDDTIAGGAGDDRLLGRGGQDTLDGGDGADHLAGGRGDDLMRGGDGADRIVDGHGANVAEGGAGDDVVMLAGSSGIALGGEGEDTLTAGAGEHLLVGEAGDDLLAVYATPIRVELDGGLGDDAIQVDAPGATGATQLVVHFGRGHGNDTVTLGTFSATAIDELRLGPGIAKADVTLRRHAGSLVLSLAGSADTLTVAKGASADDVAIGSVTLADGGTISHAELLALARAGSAFADDIVGTDGDDNLAGSDGDDTIDGRAGHDTLAGDSGADTLVGGLGNDALDGGADADTMRGGAGDDVYVVDHSSDSVIEAAGDGVDEVRSWVSRSAGANVERLRLLGTANLEAFGTDGDDDLAGNAGHNVLYGRLGADRLAGAAGDDVYYVDDGGDTLVELANEGRDTVHSAVSHALADHFEDLVLVTSAVADATGNALDNVLTGGAGANVLTGLGGHDVLDGLGGADRLVGGAGDDGYRVDHAGDVVVELPGEGADTVTSSIAFVLPSDVENLVLLGTGALAGTGNALANRLTGNTGANTIDGKAGADAMIGGKGNDTYVVDAAGDVVTELASEGTDTVQSSVTYALGANVEHLTLTGTAAIHATGNALANTLAGNAAANMLDGGAGNDTLRGGAGDDTYVVDATGDVVTENASEGIDTVRSSIAWTLGANLERLVLAGTASVAAYGNTLANTLTGNAGANVLDGKAGADAMAGGAGNDTYVVDAAGDTTSENGSEGTDLVQASVSWTLAANVENLTLTGTAAINGSGNTLANVLVGNAAANTLDGGAGNDTMRGGAGNDTFVVDAAGDVTTENAGEGTDVVRASIGWTLATNVENLVLTGTAAINGTGNTLGNALTGNAANNVLDGKAGADTMAGGAGDDVYVVDSAADVTTEAAAAGRDRVDASIAWTLAANVEDLTLTGTAAINGTGNTLGNQLLGNAATNTLAGGDGNDHLFGAAGNDALAGGNGIDLVQGGDGNDTIGDAAGNSLLDGGLGADSITGTAARELLIGGKGDDTIASGAGADVIAFNKGDGRDTLLAAAGADDTLSLGGGIRYADLGLTKVGNDLVLDAGADHVTFKDWYLATTNRRVATLQVVVDASTDYSAASTDPTRSKRVARFDFAEIATAFDAARTVNPALTRWALAGALADAHVAGSDSAALGGDLAYAWGRSGSLTSIGMDAAAGILGDANFGIAAQAFLAPAALAAGGRFLR